MDSKSELTGDVLSGRGTPMDSSSDAGCVPDPYFRVPKPHSLDALDEASDSTEGEGSGAAWPDDMSGED